MLQLPTGNTPGNGVSGSTHRQQHVEIAPRINNSVGLAPNNNTLNGNGTFFNMNGTIPNTQLRIIPANNGTTVVNGMGPGSITLGTGPPNAFNMLAPNGAVGIGALNQNNNFAIAPTGGSNSFSASTGNNGLLNRPIVFLNTSSNNSILHPNPPLLPSNNAATFSNINNQPNQIRINNSLIASVGAGGGLINGNLISISTTYNQNGINNRFISQNRGFPGVQIMQNSPRAAMNASVATPQVGLRTNLSSSIAPLKISTPQQSTTFPTNQIIRNGGLINLQNDSLCASVAISTPINGDVAQNQPPIIAIFFEKLLKMAKDMDLKKMGRKNNFEEMRKIMQNYIDDLTTKEQFLDQIKKLTNSENIPSECEKNLAPGIKEIRIGLYLGNLAISDLKPPPLDVVKHQSNLNTVSNNSISVVPVSAPSQNLCQIAQVNQLKRKLSDSSSIISIPIGQNIPSLISNQSSAGSSLQPNFSSASSASTLIFPPNNKTKPSNLTSSNHPTHLRVVSNAMVSDAAKPYITSISSSVIAANDTEPETTSSENFILIDEDMSDVAAEKSSYAAQPKFQPNNPVVIDDQANQHHSLISTTSSNLILSSLNSNIQQKSSMQDQPQPHVYQQQNPQKPLFSNQIILKFLQRYSLSTSNLPTLTTTLQIPSLNHISFNNEQTLLYFNRLIEWFARTFIEKIAMATLHRSELHQQPQQRAMALISANGTNNTALRWYCPSGPDVREQVRFLQKLSENSKKQIDDRKREEMSKVCKSRSRNEDSAHIKEKARQFRADEQRRLEWDRADQTAIEAIGGPFSFRRKQFLQSQPENKIAETTLNNISLNQRFNSDTGTKSVGQILGAVASSASASSVIIAPNNTSIRLSSRPSNNQVLLSAPSANTINNVGTNINTLVVNQQQHRFRKKRINMRDLDYVIESCPKAVQSRLKRFNAYYKMKL